MFIALVDRDYLFSFDVIDYFNGYFMNDTESDNIVHFSNKLFQEPLQILVIVNIGYIACLFK